MKRLVVAVLLALSGLVCAAIPAQAAPYGWKWDSSTVVVSDKTDGGWPVAEAVAAWNRGGSPVTLVYTTADCTHCIHVTEVAWIDCALYGGCPTNGWIGGDTDWSFNVDGSPTEAYIRLSNQTSEGATSRRLHDTSHEIGHGLGLGHDDGRSVMRNPYLPGNPVEPTSRDFRFLKEAGY